MSKYYAVKNGVVPGIYTSWDACKTQVNGYKGAVYKSFKTNQEAEQYLNDNVKDNTQNITKNNNVTPKNNNVKKLDDIDLLVYTDGSCKDSVGGYGVVFIQNDNITEYHGHLPAPCTNQIAELTAIKVALTNTNEDKIHIISDSMYCIDCFTKYIKTWKRNGFMTTEKKPVKNQQLIKDIDALMQNKIVTFEHVYSHRGEYYNEMVDQLAEKGRLNI